MTDPAQFASLPEDLQETAEYFKESLNRKSPTSKNGTTSGALLWNAWHANKYGCRPDESPMNCELRLYFDSLSRPAKFSVAATGASWFAPDRIQIVSYAPRFATHPRATLLAGGRRDN